MPETAPTGIMSGFTPTGSAPQQNSGGIMSGFTIGGTTPPPTTGGAPAAPASAPLSVANTPPPPDTSNWFSKLAGGSDLSMPKMAPISTGGSTTTSGAPAPVAPPAPVIPTPPSTTPSLKTTADFNNESGYITAQNVSLKTQADAIDALTTTLHATKVDNTNQASVDAYNAKVKDLNAKVDAYKTAAGILKPRIDAYNAAVPAFNNVANGGTMIGKTDPNTKISNPFNDLFHSSQFNDPSKINVQMPAILGFGADTFVSIPSPFPANSFGGDTTKINAVATLVASTPTLVLQAISRAIVTVKQIFQSDLTSAISGQGDKTVPLGGFEAALYGNPVYRTTYGDVQAAIQHGDGVLSAYIGAISGKTIDIVFGASMIASGFTLAAKLLAAKSPYSAIEAWKTLGSPTTEAELKTNFRTLANQFHPDKVGGDGAPFKVITEAKAIIDKGGLPTIISDAQQKAAQYLEWAGRQTKLGDPILALNTKINGERVSPVEPPAPRPTSPVVTKEIAERMQTAGEGPTHVALTSRGIAPEESTKAIEGVKAQAELEKGITPTVTQTSEINTPERVALRSEVTDKMYGTGAPIKEKRLDIVMGLPASGKSTALAEPLVKTHGALLVDSDIAKRMLPEYGKGEGAPQLRKESSSINGAVYRKALMNGDNIVFPTLGADINVLNKSIDMAKAKGYDVHVHHLEISPEESAKRAVTRFKKGGQFIDPNYIIHRVGLQPAINSASLKDDERLTSHTHYDGAGKKGTAPAILNSRENSTKGLDKTGGESVSATHGGKSDVRVNGTANPIRKGTGTSSREDRANQGEVDGRANRSGVLEAEKESVTKPRIEAAAKEIVPEDKSLILTSEDAKKDTPLKINGEEVKRPDVLVSKSELKDLINTLPDKQGDFKVVLNPEGQMRMNLTTPTGTMSLRPSALGLVESQLREGDVIHVDADNLKPKGTSYRVMNKDNKVEASGGGSPSTTRMVKPTFSNEMNRGFVNPGEVIKQASDYLEKTSSNAAAAKNLDDEVYNVGKNVEADAIETNKLLKEFRKIPKEDVRMIDIYRDELEAGLTPPALTPEQQRLNDEVINPLLKDAASKAAYIRAKGVDVDIAPPMDHETYNPRMTKDKGGVIDAAIRTKDKLLNKSGAGKRNILSQSAPSLKPRVHGALTYENGQRVTTSHVDGHILQHNVDGTTTDLGPTKQKVSTKVKEFYDPEVRGKLEQLAKDLGIKHERHATGRTTGLGGKRAGVSFTGESLIKTRLGPDSVLAHELGHQIDEKYGLQAFMSEERFDAQHKTELAREMRALADERFAGAETTKGFKAYVRKGSEKMAVMFEAYISNEQLFKDVAPHLYDDFRQFLSDHAELRPFLDIKGSVQLSSMTHGGEYLGGKKGDTFIDKFGKKWTIGEATKAEIERVTTTRYYHNPFLAAALIHENITQVYRAVKMLEDYKKSPEFANVAMEKGTGTPPDNWKLGPIDQFRNYFVEPDTWKVMNAYKNELESGNDPIRPLTMINNFMLHTMFLAPVKHGLNVAVTAFAHRGMTRWMNPLAYPTLARTSIKAIMDVLRQNDDFLTTLRDGASFMSAKKDYQGRQDDILALVGEETDATKKAYQLAKKTIGAVTPFNWVHAMVWPMTDIFMHQAILEGLARQGLTVKTSTSAQRMAIIRNVGKTIPTYRQSVTMRQAPSWVRRNALVFMSWRESMYRNMYGIGREIITGEDLANPRTFTQDSNGKYRHSYFDKESWKTRGSAFNTAISIGFLSLLVWPYLKDEWQKLSKNANASIFMPSFLGVIDNANKFASGKIDIGQYIETLVDMPPFSRESLQQIINTDIFTHQAIRDNTTTAGEQFNQSIQHFEKSATVLDQYNRVNSGALSGKQLIESQFGLNDPDAVQTKLVAAVQTAQTRVDKLDTTTVETVRAIYDQAKAAGFGTPEADALVSPLDAADYKIYQDLKTIDQAKETVALSAKIQPIVNEAYQLGFGTPEADALVANLSDPEMTAYHAIKTILYGAKGTGQPNFTPGTTTNDTSIIGSVLAYANAIRTDPLTAFERIFTGQRILRTENGTIIVERNSPLEARVKAQLGGTTEMTLDHLKSFELGGDNSSGNMWLVPKAQAAIDDKVENMLGAALSAGKIDGKQAQEYELRYKKGADAAEIDARTKSTFDSVGAPLTLDQITELLK